MVVIFGCGYSTKMILDNYYKYIDYPSFMKEETEKNYTTKFPKITICLNSMHSLEKLLRYEPTGRTYRKKVFTDQNRSVLEPD